MNSSLKLYWLSMKNWKKIPNLKQSKDNLNQAKNNKKT